MSKGLDSRAKPASTEGSCPAGAARDGTGATTAVEHSAKSHSWADACAPIAASFESSLTAAVIVMGLKMAHSDAALYGSMSAAASTMVGR